MTEALLKYGQAMDTVDWRSAFLALWQILEMMSLNEPGTLKMPEVAARIGNLIGARPLVKELVDCLAQSRNLLVHKGRFSEEGLEEVNFLKIIAETAVSAFLRKAKQFSDQESLEEFYRHATVSDKALHIRRKVIDAILNSRQ